MNRFLDSRKRYSSPLPPPLDHMKRERRLSSQSSETSASSEDSLNKLKCRLCKKRNVVFKDTDSFYMHLSMIHYRDKLSDQLGKL